MNYQEQLQKINNAAESGDISAIEEVKNTVKSERVEGENMGNSMVLMAAEKALEKLSQMKKEVVEIPDWRRDQINRTGGTVEEIDRITNEINQQTEKSVIQGWYNILKQIPESMRSAEQQREFEEYEKELGAISKSTEQTVRGVAAERVENERVAENLEKLDLNKINPVDAAINETLGKYTEHMSSHIASGASLWDIPSDEVDDEPVAFTQPIQPTAEKINEAHKEYLENEIDKIGSAISAGLGNEQVLERGISLEKKLEEHNRPQLLGEENFQKPEQVPVSFEQAEQSPKTPEGFGAIIANLNRDDLGSVYGILKEQGNIDGSTPDQVWASIKLYMRGASDESHIPESYGLRSKMMEIKKIRDDEHVQLGISIDRESGAATVDKTPIINSINTAPELINEMPIESAPGSEMEPVSELENISENKEELGNLPNTAINNTVEETYNKNIENTFDFFKTPSIELTRELQKMNSIEEKFNVLEHLNLIQPIEIEGKKYNAVDYAGRVMVIGKIGNLSIPFYISTGSAGKKTVEAGKWYAVFGIGDDGWINKGTEEVINSQYENPALQKIAKILNEGIGSISLRENNGRIKEGYHFLSDEEIDVFNKNLHWDSKPVSHNTEGTFWSHAKNILNSLNSEMIKMQENNGYSEKLKTVNSLPELYQTLKSFGKLQGSSQEFTSDVLQKLVEEYINNADPTQEIIKLNSITRTAGLREKVLELKKNLKNQNSSIAA